MDESKLLSEYKKSGMTIYEFFRFTKSNVIADIQKASLFLNCKYEDEEKENIISECLRIKEKLEKEREHKKKVKATIDLAYDLYCKSASAVKKLPKDYFQMIYEAICKICFDGTDLECNNKARQAAELLRSIPSSLDESDERMGYLCFLKQSFSVKRSVEEFAKTPDESLLFEKKFSKIKKALKDDNDNWQDAACAFYYSRESNDIELETRFVYYAFSRHLDITKKAELHVSIIEPSPFFIRKWMKDSSLEGIKTDFVINDKHLRAFEKEIYGKRESAYSFLSVEEFRKQLERGSSDYTLLFGNHMDDSAEKASLIEKIIREARDKNSFFMLGDDYEICSPKSPVHQELTEMSIRRIDLLPGDLLYATTPKRKMFVGAEYGYLNTDDKKPLFYVVFYSLEKEGSYQSISPKIHFEKLPQEDFLSPKKQLRSVYYDGNRKFLTKTEKKRNQAEKYAFSNEIVFYYTIFSKDDSIPEKRIRAYACISDTDACYKERVLRSESEKLKIKMSDIDEWLENEFPYHTKSTKEKEKISIQSLISEKFKAELKVCRKSKSRMDFPFRRISLKTFAFVYEDEIGESEKEIETLRFLGKSVLGDYDLTKISAKMLSSFIEENSSDFPSSVSKTVAILHKLFDLAMELEQCNCNPVTEIEYKNRDKFEELDEVRTAISKRFFTVAEMDRMITKCFGKFEKGDNLSAAVLIRIFTGLDASVISALKWNDLKSFKTSTGKEIFQLSVNKKIGKDNNFAPLSKSQQIRLIPLCEELENIILSLREKEREKYETISEDQFGEKAIIAGNKITVHAVTGIMLPERVNKVCKKLVKELKIDCEIIAVPENKYGVTDDNLNTYGGDIFRNSFRHYLLRSNDISNGELCYLLGIVSEDVDYDHYIDCSSDRKQEQLYLAIQKYAYLIRGVVCRGE